MPLTQYAFKENETAWKDLAASVRLAEYAISTNQYTSNTIKGLLAALYRIVPKEMFAPAAPNSPSQDFPTGAFSGTSHFASEPQASEGERNLNSPREAVGLYPDIRKLAIELGFFGYELNIQKSK